MINKIKKKFIITIFLAFILNLIWEFSHYRLYFDLSGIPTYPHLIIATIADAFIISVIFLIISIKNKKVSWIIKPKNIDYILTIILGLLIAGANEYVNVYVLGRWAYKELMPTILGIGLSPLVQLSLTAIIALIINKKINS